MIITINSKRQVITDIVHDSEQRMVTITCGDNVYRRTYGMKFDILK